MQVIANYLKKKGVGFYLIVASIVLALILAITFFALYKGDNGNGQKNMANGAYGAIPEVIGIFALIGLALDISAILVPELALIHLGAVVCYAISFGKMAYTIADVIAGIANDIAYEGGNPALLFTWMAMQVLMIVMGIVACFLGQENKNYKEEAGNEYEEVIKNA